MSAWLRAALLSMAVTLSFASGAHAQVTPARTPEEALPEAAVRPEVMRRVMLALLVIEGEAPASFYAALGIEGRDALLAIVRDADRPVGLRRRAVLALHHYATPLVRTELEARASSGSEDAIVSRYALRSLGSAFGAAVFDVIAARLEDARPLVREGAAIALSAINRARARPILTALLRTEGERFIRETVTALLAS